MPIYTIVYPPYSHSTILDAWRSYLTKNSMNLNNDVITRINKLVNDAENVLNTEFEVRFSTFTKDLYDISRPTDNLKPAHYQFVPLVDEAVFHRVLTWLNDGSDNVLKDENALKSTYTETIEYLYQGNLRQVCPIEPEGEPHFCTKSKMDNFDIFQYGIRLATSQERSIRYNQSANKEGPRLSRHKRRTSYWSQATPYLRYDLTHVITDKFKQGETPKNGYEIEIEWIPKQNGTTEQLLHAVSSVLSVMQDSPYLITLPDKHNTLVDIFKMTGKRHFIGAQPETLHKSQLVSLLMTPYSVTDKIDGERCLLFIRSDGYCYLINRKMQVRSIQVKVGNIDSTANTVLDVELTSDGKIHIFDICIYAGTDLRGKEQYNLRARLDMAKLICDNLEMPKRIFMKTFIWNMEELPELVKKVSATNNEDGLERDGLIFTPVNESYPIRPGWDTLLKWKPPSMNSVDFQVVFAQNSEVTPQNSARVSLHVGQPDNSTVPFAPCSRLVADEPTMASLWDGCIAECVFSNTDKAWNILRVRQDKVKPNYIRVAQNVWDSLQDPVEIEDLVNIMDLRLSAPVLQIATKLSSSHPQQHVQHNIPPHRGHTNHIPAVQNRVPVKIGAPRYNQTKPQNVSPLALPRSVSHLNTQQQQSPAITVISQSTIKGGQPVKSVQSFEKLRKAHNVIKTRVIKDAVSQFKSTDVLRVLDLGCGRGGDIFKWEKISQVVEYVGIDVNETLLQEAHTRAKSLTRLKSSFIQCNLTTEFPSVQGEFQIVTCQFAFHYFLSSEKVFYHFMNIVHHFLANDGIFILTTLDASQVLDAFSTTARGGPLTLQDGSGTEPIVLVNKCNMDVGLDAMRQRFFNLPMHVSLIADDVPVIPVVPVVPVSGNSTSLILNEYDQDEYLVFSDSLVKRLAQVNYELQSTQLFDCDKSDLPPHHAVYSHLNRWYRFKKRDGLENTSTKPVQVKHITNTLRSELSVRDNLYRLVSSERSIREWIKIFTGLGDMTPKQLSDDMTKVNPPSYNKKEITRILQDICDTFDTIVIFGLWCPAFKNVTWINPKNIFEDAIVFHVDARGHLLLHMDTNTQEFRSTWSVPGHLLLQNRPVAEAVSTPAVVTDPLLATNKATDTTQQSLQKIQEMQPLTESFDGITFMERKIEGRGKDAWSIKELKDMATSRSINMPSSLKKKVDMAEHLFRQMSLGNVRANDSSSSSVVEKNR